MSRRGFKKRIMLLACHRKDPRCRMCRQLTVIRPQQAGGRTPTDTAVLCRWWPKDHPANDLPPGKPRRRLTCFRCAQTRHATFTAERPIEELWARSGRAGSVYFVQGAAE